LNRLQYLDLGEIDPLSHKWRPNKEFRAGRWEYPAEVVEHFVPTAPLLFVAFRGCTNVQFCDWKFQVSYLAKYAAGIDEKPQVTFTSSHKDSKIIDSEVVL
jgi:hypothetical protein